jgi:glycosyltransferase involved in cell wall biosynthesis
MQVMVDARMAFHGGIGRYIRSLCCALVKQDPTLNLVLFVDPRTADGVRRAIESATILPFPAPIYSIREQLQSFRWHGDGTHSPSLFHFPHYNVPWFLSRNSVVTIHDLTHFQFPQYFGRLRGKLALRLLQRAVRRAGHIVAVSQATRQALETVLPEAKGKTSVIYHGVDDHFAPLPAAMNEDFKRAARLGRFLLYVGNSKPHKNLARLLQAFANVRAQYHIGLVLLGVAPSPSWSHLQGVHVLPQVADAQLVQWYNAAEALLLPSLNEGFGFPALEAMACGTPVIAANVSALPEIVGDAGLLIDPYDGRDLAQAIKWLISDQKLHERLRRRGLERAKDFSWSATATQTLDLYQEITNR